MNDIAVARTRRETDNTKTSPTDLLETVLADIREGKIKVDTIFVVYARREEGAIVEFNTARCGLTRVEEVGLLQTAVTTAVIENTP